MIFSVIISLETFYAYSSSDATGDLQDRAHRSTNERKRDVGEENTNNPFGLMTKCSLEHVIESAAEIAALISS